MFATRTARAAHAPVASAPKVARTRAVPVRKQLLFAEHEHLLTANDLVLFLRPGDFTAQEWRALRGQLAPAAPATNADPHQHQLKLTLLRPGLLPALLRSASASATASATASASASASTSTESGPSSSSSSVLASLDLSHLSTASHLSGPLAVLTSSSLHPPTLSRVLSLLQTFSRTPPPNAPPPAPDAPPLERLELLSSLLEKSQAATPKRTKEVGDLPSLDVLRAQIVGLLSAPGARITGVLGARASEVGRTLEGFKKGLEEQSKGPAEAEATA
ncbi:hypothetical protein JCM1841_000916 [Sporobolomyces salmonicolor]